jgi:hypothetical protein
MGLMAKVVREASRGVFLADAAIIAARYGAGDHFREPWFLVVWIAFSIALSIWILTSNKVARTLGRGPRDAGQGIGTTGVTQARSNLEPRGFNADEPLSVD